MEAATPFPELRRLLAEPEGFPWPYVVRADRDPPTVVLPWEPDRRLVAIFHNGQSLSAAGGALLLRKHERLATRVPPEPLRGLMFRSGTLSRPFSRVEPAELEDLAPACESVRAGESQGTSLLRYLIRAARAAGELPDTFLYRSIGLAGRRVDQLGPGSVPFDNLLHVARAATRLAWFYGRPGLVIPACPWTQGEADRKHGVARADYLPALLAYAKAAEAALRAITRQREPVWITIDQLAAPREGDTSPGIPLAQLDAAEDAGSRVVMVGPKYMLRDRFGLVDNVHLRPAGYAVLGEYHAKAIRQLMGGGAGKPELALRPDRAGLRREGRRITIPLLGAVGEVVIDQESLPPAPDLGFDHPAGIEGVVVTGGAIQVTLRGDATGALRYACRSSTVGLDENRYCAWGNVRDSDRAESLAVPGLRLFNWLVAFEIASV